MRPEERLLLKVWPAVALLSLSQLVAWGTLYYAYAIVSVPIANGLGVSQALVAGAFSLALIASGVAAGPVGRMMDARGARRALVIGAVMGPLALAAVASSRGPVTLLASFTCLGASFAFALYDPALRAVVEWLPAARARSHALLLITSVGGLASTLFLPLTVAFVERWDFRRALLALAALLLAVSLPVALALPTTPHREPTRSRLEPRVGPRRIGLLSAAFALHALASTGVAVCLVWHLVVGGADLASAAAKAGLMGAAQVAGRILLGPLQRALSSAARAPLLFGLQAIALLAIARPSGTVATNIAILMFGASSGAMTIERATVVAEWFGVSHFGVHNGRIARASAFAKAAAPFTVELVREPSSYVTALEVLAVALLAGGALVLAAGRRNAREVSSVRALDRESGNGRPDDDRAADESRDTGQRDAS